jgi:hypothetical protein
MWSDRKTELATESFFRRPVVGGNMDCKNTITKTKLADGRFLGVIVLDGRGLELLERLTRTNNGQIESDDMFRFRTSIHNVVDGRSKRSGAELI